jgi:uncharacterized protein (TIGR02118 family)
MSTIIVLFNLKPGSDPSSYERWARSTDLPIVQGLKSVRSFEVLKTTGLLGGGSSPYQYVEILCIADEARFVKDLSSPIVQRVAAEFQQFADQPLFVTTEPLAAAPPAV